MPDRGSLPILYLYGLGGLARPPLVLSCDFVTIADEAEKATRAKPRRPQRENRQRAHVHFYRAGSEDDGVKHDRRLPFESPLAPALLLLAIACWPGFEEPGRALREGLLPVLAMLSLAWRVRPGTSALPGSLLAAVLALSAMAGLSLLAAPRPEWSPTLRDTLISIAPWFFALAATRTREGSILAPDLRLAPVLSLATLFVSLPILSEAWFAWSVFPSAAPPAGPFINRNVAAAWLVPLVPLLLGALVSAENERRRWMLAMATATTVAALIATRSRGGWLAVAVALLVLTLLAFPKADARRALFARSKGALLAVGIFAAIALFIPVRSGESLPTATRTLGMLARASGESVEIRKALWANATAMIEAHPLIGVGSGRFAVEYPLYHQARRETPDFGLARQPRHVHNDFLETAVEWGLPAAGVWLALNVVVIVGWRRRRCDARDVLVTSGQRAALAGILVHSMVSFPWHSPATSALAATLIGALWPVGRPASLRSMPKIPFRKKLAPIAWLAAALAVCTLAIEDLRGQAALARALDAVKRGACDEAVEESRQVSPRRRNDLGLAAMIRFHCDPSPEATRPILEEAVKVHPHQLNLLLALGPRQLKSGDAPAAEQTFLHALEIAPEQPRAWLGLAMAHERLGDLAATRRACARALEFDPTWNPALAYCIGNGFVPAR